MSAIHHPFLQKMDRGCRVLSTSAGGRLHRMKLFQKFAIGPANHDSNGRRYLSLDGQKEVVENSRKLGEPMNLSL